MKREIAERIAATTVEGVTVEQTQMIIREFLRELARCPVCDNTGTFTFGRDVTLDLTDTMRRPVGGDDRVVRAGTTGPCPRCGVPEPGGNGDPDHLSWHCTQGGMDSECRQAKSSQDTTRRDGHADCGWRIMLPVDADTV